MFENIRIIHLKKIPIKIYTGNQGRYIILVVPKLTTLSITEPSF